MSDDVKTQLRLPPELHAAVKALAEKELRSFNAQIQVLLREAIEARQHAQLTPAGRP
jgi:hypothetical protein